MSKIETVAPNPGTIKENNREPTANELEAVAGGTPKLYEAACKGKVFSHVEIHGTAGDLPGGIRGRSYGWNDM